MKHRLRSAASLITVLVPAHNEADGIEQTLGSLLGQDPRPDRIVVVADNCTDDTVALVREFAEHSAVTVQVHETVDNLHKKAGALNQYLAVLLPTLKDDDYVLVMDADSLLSEVWIGVALQTFNDSSIGAVGGIFYGEGRNGLIEQLQRNEYVRYARDILRRKRGVFVLTGTSTMFRVSVLREITESRGNQLPGKAGVVYDLNALTEDMEITLACLQLGYRCVSPPNCATTTELMPTWRDLWRQRIRWQRGAIDNLRSYGVNKTTIPYMFQQIWAVCGFLVIVGYPTLLALSSAMGEPLVFHPFWICVGILSVTDRIVTVRKSGWKGIALTLGLIPEMIYDFFRLGVYIAGWRDAILRRDAKWFHVAEPVSQDIKGSTEDVCENRGHRDSGRNVGLDGVQRRMDGPGSTHADHGGGRRHQMASEEEALIPEQTRFLPAVGELNR